MERSQRTAGEEYRGRFDRGVAPIGVVLLIAITVVLAGGIAGATMAASTTFTGEPTPTASISLSAEGDRITLDHRGGDRIDVGKLDVVVSVDGEKLDRQPPVPYFSASGFRPGPAGPFNAASDDGWVAGERASFSVAGTNSPSLRPGRRVEVRLIVADRPVTTLETTVRDG